MSGISASAETASPWWRDDHRNRTISGPEQVLLVSALSTGAPLPAAALEPALPAPSLGLDAVPATPSASTGSTARLGSFRPVPYRSLLRRADASASYLERVAMAELGPAAAPLPLADIPRLRDPAGDISSEALAILLPRRGREPPGVIGGTGVGEERANDTLRPGRTGDAASSPLLLRMRDGLMPLPPYRPRRDRPFVPEGVSAGCNARGWLTARAATVLPERPNAADGAAAVRAGARGTLHPCAGRFNAATAACTLRTPAGSHREITGRMPCRLRPPATVTAASGTTPNAAATLARAALSISPPSEPRRPPAPTAAPAVGFASAPLLTLICSA
jgi:hypothetical protein